MAEDNVGEKSRNGGVVDDGEQDPTTKTKRKGGGEELTLFAILNRLITSILFPGPDSTTPLFHRIKSSLSENVPLIREATRNTGRNVYFWTRRGSPFRALLVVSVGTVTLLTLSGLLVFMLFFLAASICAIVISLLMSLAAAGGFLALFFTCVTVIYIVALSIAAFVISTATISAILAAIIATGWIGFFFAAWLATKKSVSLAKHSLSMTGSALSAYSLARHTRRHHD